MINTSHITFNMIEDSLYDYEKGRREFDDPNLNKLMQDKELFQDFLNHYKSKTRMSSRVMFMFNIQFIQVLGEMHWDSKCLDEREKIDYDAEYNKIIMLLASFTEEDIKKYTNALISIIELAMAQHLLKLLDIILTYVDLNTLKRNFVIADMVQSHMGSCSLPSRSESDRQRLSLRYVEILKVFLNHGVDIVEFFKDGFIFNGLPEIHPTLIKAGYDYSDYLSSKYLDTDVDTEMLIRESRDHRRFYFYKFTLKKEHKQVIKDEFMSSMNEAGSWITHFGSLYFLS